MNIGDHKEALERLMKGNERFVKGRAIQPNGSPEHRRELLAGQEPFAVVLGCSDSRVPPEIIFDCGLGEIFVIRVAGNILDNVVMGSIEYAVEHLETRLVLVLGHESCGAVGACLDGGEAGGHIGSIVKAIWPAVETAKAQKGDLYGNAIRRNVERTVEELRGSEPILSRLVDEGGLKIIGGVYELESGRVEYIC